jgi:hypothetical protein
MLETTGFGFTETLPMLETTGFGFTGILPMLETKGFGVGVGRLGLTGFGVPSR